MFKSSSKKHLSGGDMRLASGGRINRDKPLQFTFDGKTYGGYEGDTLACIDRQWCSSGGAQF